MGAVETGAACGQRGRREEPTATAGVGRRGISAIEPTFSVAGPLAVETGAAQVLGIVLELVASAAEVPSRVVTVEGLAVVTADVDTTVAALVSRVVIENVASTACVQRHIFRLAFDHVFCRASPLTGAALTGAALGSRLVAQGFTSAAGVRVRTPGVLTCVDAHVRTVEGRVVGVQARVAGIDPHVVSVIVAPVDVAEIDTIDRARVANVAASIQLEYAAAVLTDLTGRTVIVFNAATFVDQAAAVESAAGQSATCEE